MWRCKKCGSGDIYGSGTITGGSWGCTSPATKEERCGECDIDDWDGPIDEWSCNDCRARENTLEELAEWVEE